MGKPVGDGGPLFDAEPWNARHVPVAQDWTFSPCGHTARDPEVVMRTPAAKPSLPPFSGDAPVCEKCGYEGASTRYMDAGRCIDGGVVLGFEPNERLHRECLRCGFDWDEALADGTL